MRLGVAGSLTTLVGIALMLLSALASTLAGGDVLGGAFFIGFLAAIVGLALLGAMTLRAQVMPAWCGVVLIVALPLSAILANYGGDSAGSHLVGARLCTLIAKGCTGRAATRAR